MKGNRIETIVNDTNDMQNFVEMLDLDLKFYSFSRLMIKCYCQRVAPVYFFQSAKSQDDKRCLKILEELEAAEGKNLIAMMFEDSTGRILFDLVPPNRAMLSLIECLEPYLNSIKINILCGRSVKRSLSF